MDMNLSKLREIVEDRGAWRAVVHEVTKSQTRLSDWTELNNNNQLKVRMNNKWNETHRHSNISWGIPLYITILRVQFSSITQSCLTVCDPMDRSTPGLPVHHQLPEFTQTHVHWVSDAIQPSHPLSSPSPPALSLSQHQGLFKRVSSSHQMAKALEFQLQHQSFQWSPRTDLL